MARPKLISDAAILAIVRDKILAAGEKAASFREIAAATGLSAPALVLRFSSQSGMVSAALVDGWHALAAHAKTSQDILEGHPKSVQGFLKAQADVINIPALLAHSLRDGAATAAATDYRQQIEDILTRHFGGGPKAQQTAAAIFAAWQGRLAWDGAGEKTLRFGAFLRQIS